MNLLKILAFVATITAKNNFHGKNQKRENRNLTNQKARIFSFPTFITVWQINNTNIILKKILE